MTFLRYVRNGGKPEGKGGRRRHEKSMLFEMLFDLETGLVSL